MAERRIINGYIVEQQPDGTLVTIGPANPGGGQTFGQPSPDFPFKGPQAAAEVQKTQAQTDNSQANAVGQQIQNQVKAATAPADIQKAGADTTKAKLEAQGGSANVRQDAINQYNGADQLETIANNLEQQYNAHFKGNSFANGVREYNPFLSQNKVFNDTADQARGFIKNALGYTGGEGNTIGEVQLNYGPYLPQNSDRDEQILQKIGAMRNLAARARKRATETLGGVPGPNGTITPFDSNPGGGQAVATGATRNIFDPAVASGLNALVQQRRPYGEAAAFARQHGFPEPSQQEYAAALAWQKSHPAASYDASNPRRQVPTTGFERFVSSPVGAAAAGFADMGLPGVLRGATGGDKLDAIASDHPIAFTLGQVGGALGGTSLLSKASSFAIKKALPDLIAERVLTGGGKLGMFGRNLAADTAYGGIYGATSGEGAGQDAALGALGSIGGQALGHGLGAAVGGLKVAPAVDYLRSRGVPMTIGQRAGGGVKAVENAATSGPIFGDRIAARYGDSFNGFNRAAFNDPAFGAVGVKAQGTGEQAADNLLNDISSYYRTSTAGVDAPLDPAFSTDAATARAFADKLPPEAVNAYNKAIDNYLTPIEQAGTMTGDQFHSAFKGLKNAKARVPQSATGFEEHYRNGISAAQDALSSQIKRAGGEEVIDRIALGDAAWRRAKVLQDAVKRARNGPRSGEVQVFTPSQLNDAAWASQTKFGGQRPFAELADAGQEVLPSRVPDSGTTQRAIQLGLGAAALGGAEASDRYGDTNLVNPYSLGGIALLTLGGTKAGQKALGKVLFDRPSAADQVGNYLRRRAGMFGHVGVPLAISAGREGY